MGETRQVFLNHLAIALGSQAELEIELELASRLWKAEVSRAQERANEVGKLLHGLINTIERARKPLVGDHAPAQSELTQ